MKKKGVLVKPPWFSDKVDWKKFTSASHATADDNLDLVRGIFSFYNLDMKVHNNYPVVEEQLAAGEDNEQDEDQEEPGLLARAVAENDLDVGEEEEIAEGAALAPLNEEQLVGGVREQENVEEGEEETDMDEESTEKEDLASEEEEVLELNLSISDDDLGGEEVEVEMAEQDGDLELPNPEARLNIEQERIVKKSNCVGQAKKQKRALSVRKRTPSKRVRKVPIMLLD